MKAILRASVTLTMALFLTFSSFADEGMWLPSLIGKNYQDMKKQGFMLTAEDIYNINKASLKDAIVSFQFCTGEFVSKSGLILTNHHCAYSSIQQHSTVTADYLKDGFWASNKSEELPAEGVTASVLIRMEDVTSQITAAIAGMDEATKAKAIKELSKEIESNATAGTFYTAQVKSLFHNNQYFVFVYEMFPDVRLVGAPPSSIGKFGGDADNWEWPRHTGDFAMFRLYTGPDGKPAAYNKENVAYEPRQHLKVSTKGVKEGDFAMTMGYPGSTNRYAFSRELEYHLNKRNQVIIDLFGKRLEIMRADMDADPAVNIKLAGSYASLANTHKYFIGQTQGLKKDGVIAEKKELEQKVAAFASKSSVEGMKTLFEDVDALYAGYDDISLNTLYMFIGGYASDIATYARTLSPLYEALVAGNTETVNKLAENYRAGLNDHFKDYVASTDQKLLAGLLTMFYNDISEAQRPQILNDIVKSSKGNTIAEKFDNYAADVFNKSILDNKDLMDAFLKAPNLKVLKKDPIFALNSGLMKDYYPQFAAQTQAFSSSLGDYKKLYTQALLQMNTNKNMYPDANSTLRISYGNIMSYQPRDGVSYSFYTTTDGILEKEDPNDREFIVPDALKRMLKNKNLGRYTNEKGELPVAFISNNDITGGNSGSPVLNGNGELIGIAFDGNWEAMTGDLAFNTEVQRTISVDIRYVLYIIENYAKAAYLVQEMDLVN